MSDTVPFGESDGYDAFITATNEARLAFFRTLGEPEPHIWTHYTPPAFHGLPDWPTRPAWQVMRRNSDTLIATSGLSDPFFEAEGPTHGLGIEILVGTADPITASAFGSTASWLFDLIARVSYYAASAEGRFLQRYAKYGLFLIGIHAGSYFAEQADSEGFAGVLVGLPVLGVTLTFQLPAGETRLLAAKLLMKREYEYVAAEGLPAANDLSRKFAEDGSDYLSSHQREAVV
jgi:hypothetical protein